jgi:hypothetical protein
MRYVLALTLASIVPLLVGCGYRFFPEKRWNDERLSCAEIDQQISEVDEELNRGFWREWGLQWHWLFDHGLHSQRQESRASAERRKSRLLVLKDERTCDAFLR